MDIDYEEYEVIYLSISVTDLNQEVNYDTADGKTFFSKVHYSSSFS